MKQLLTKLNNSNVLLTLICLFTLKTIIFGIGYSDAIVFICLTASFGYNSFITRRQLDEIQQFEKQNEQLRNKLNTITNKTTKIESYKF